VETRSKENGKSTEGFLSNVISSCTTIFMIVTVTIKFVVGFEKFLQFLSLIV